MRSDEFGLYYVFLRRDAVIPPYRLDGVEFEKTEQPQNAIAPNGLLFYIISAGIEKVNKEPDKFVKKAVLL